ncbi:MAG: response regulator transcription factor [Ignavibacteriaceae bacterium]|nr:response regulator transcription factor [Ignavibacteriaceae bacterium]
MKLKKNTYLDMINVGIVEDDTEIREAICSYLNDQENIRCELAEESVEKFVRILYPDKLPNVILMDIGLPGMSGISGIKLIKEKYPEIDILMLTVHNDPHKIFQSLCAGATGYLLKTTPLTEIKRFIEELSLGGAPMSPQIARRVIEFFQEGKEEKEPSPLTQKEKEIVLDLVDGLSYKMIADKQSVSIDTVRTHIKHIYNKLHVHCKADVIRKSLQGEI